jgi:branched-chain amino acid transport system ATP-binding protein
MPALLEAENLEAQYGWTKVLHGLSFAVEAGGITTILGANGAGKTTTLRAVCRMVKTSGQVRFDGQRIDGKTTDDIVRPTPTPRGARTFVDLTVEENLCPGPTRADRDLNEDYDKVYDTSGLAQRRRQAGTLGGEQQMLAVARALCPGGCCSGRASLTCPAGVREIFRIVRTINQHERVSVLLVEQNASIALELAHHAYLLETGRVVMSGPAAELKKDDAIRRSYRLGIERRLRTSSSSRSFRGSPPAGSTRAWRWPS